MQKVILFVFVSNARSARTVSPTNGAITHILSDRRFVRTNKSYPFLLEFYDLSYSWSVSLRVYVTFLYHRSVKLEIK